MPDSKCLGVESHLKGGLSLLAQSHQFRSSVHMDCKLRMHSILIDQPSWRHATFPMNLPGSSTSVLSICRDMADSIANSALPRIMEASLCPQEYPQPSFSSFRRPMANTTYAWNVLCGVIQLHNWKSSVVEAASKGTIMGMTSTSPSLRARLNAQPERRWLRFCNA